MASRSDIEAGKAHVLLYLKNQLTGGIKSAGQQLQGLGTNVMTIGAGMAGLGAAIVAPLAAAVTHFASVGSELNDMSARTGQSVGSLAELKFAAEQTGASLEDVEKAILKQQRNGLGNDFDAVARK